MDWNLLFVFVKKTWTYCKLCFVHKWDQLLREPPRLCSIWIAFSRNYRRDLNPTRIGEIQQSRLTPAVCASWGLDCWQNLGASGWRSDLEFSCWPTARRGPAGFLRPPPGSQRAACYSACFSGPNSAWYEAERPRAHVSFPLTLSIIIWAEGSTLSSASVQLSQGWAKTPSMVSRSSGFTFKSLQGADGGWQGINEKE